MNPYSHNRAFGGMILGFLGGVAVWALFGDKIKEKVSRNAAYQEMKDEVMKRVSEISDMTESKYNQVVDEVSSVYSRAKGISQNELQDLVSDLRFHWARIKHRWNEPQKPESGSSSEYTY